MVSMQNVTVDSMIKNIISRKITVAGRDERGSSRSTQRRSRSVAAPLFASMSFLVAPAAMNFELPLEKASKAVSTEPSFKSDRLKLLKGTPYFGCCSTK